MNKKILIIIVAALLIGERVSGDEGMWLPYFLSKNNVEKLEELGSVLSPVDIYDYKKSSIKDAVIVLDHGSCTGEIVSPEGLFFTNNHCGYSDIQKLSTEEDNILRDGFWAGKKEDELPVTGKSVSFLINVEDVTDSILLVLNDEMTEEQRNSKIISASIELERRATKGNHYESSVEAFYSGNKYFLFTYETFYDIRLVGTPPHFIGKFGAETDNWMWPRHNGDFAIFRIYTDKEGKPASYSKDNIPLKPKHFFPIYLGGYENGDFSMVMGYPGTTNRYLTSEGVTLTRESINKARIRNRKEKLEILSEYMSTGITPTLKYAGKYARSSNYYKYSVGQNKGVERLKVNEKKQSLEEDFTKWVNETEERKIKYGQALTLISEAYVDKEDNIALQFLIESYLYGPEIFNFSLKFRELRGALKKSSSKELVEIFVEKMEEILVSFYKDYDAETDKRIVASLAEIYSKNVNKKYLPDFYKVIENKYKNNFEKWADDIFKKSMFDDENKIKAFLKDPKISLIENDPVYKISQDISKEIKKIRNENEIDDEKLDKGYRLLLSGLMEMNPDIEFYPDANSTMRLTYGKVQDYRPSDAIHYNYYTTLKGYIEKEIPGDKEFNVWPRLKELYYAGDYGEYKDKDSTLHTCFITNNDITGGNSGSPVLNTRGELIGIAFDGNWEAMSGDMIFEPEYQRCINVDVRFVLWVIDKFAGATNIIDELTIIK